MKIFDLNGKWNLTGAGFNCYGTVPGSVYSVLLENKLMDDPFWRDNELKSLKLMENEFTFSKDFDFEKDDNITLLHCDGLDTLCDIYINEKHIAYTDNMHRTYEFDATDALVSGKNEIKIVFHPIDEYIKEKDSKYFLPGCSDSMRGFGHLRKAHCMMGWDWGPRLPDAGIWRNIYLITKDSARIVETHITQRHENNKVFIMPEIKTDIPCNIKVTLTDPMGKSVEISANEEYEIENPLLWWPNGLGEQNLYTVTAEIIDNGITVDKTEKRIGLRTLKLIREKDVYGECFCHEVNGIKFFAMGADYIPEDNILSRVTKERTRKLLVDCKNCNFNAIRVWGGGYYPDDFFFDICDELGLVVFLDMMFACTAIHLPDEMLENISLEIEDNLKRVRHHACLAIICGNNEIECFKVAQELKDTIIYLFEGVIADIHKKLCPYIPYISSSPTTCGHFIEPNNPNYGDCHYWEVWHSNKPFTEYRNYYFRYLSEFGFQSFPCEKTVNSFTEEGDRNIFSRIMEMHQRNGNANGKILNYLSQTFLYPSNFRNLLFASQLLQAEAIKYGVEHFRRNRGRCMGTLYWQLNDIWPVASWASIDYFGRYKALQYVAKRFYSPVLISCEETGEKTTRPNVTMEQSVYDYETKAILCVTNDTLEDVCGTVTWALRNSDGTVLKESSQDIKVAALSAKHLSEINFNKTDVENNYLSYEFIVDNIVVSEGTVLFTAPKHFNFKNPHLRYEIHGNEITVFSDCYAKYVEIYSPDSDFVLSDNYFDLNADSKTVRILEGTPKTINLYSVYDIR